MKNKIAAFSILVLVVLACNNKKNSTISSDGAVALLTTPIDSVSGEPYLFTDAAGVVYLSWIQKDKDSSSLKFSRLNQENWSAPITIASGSNWFVNWADYPMMTTENGDSLLAHYLEKSEKGKYTYDVKTVASFDKGNSWSNTKILHDDGKKAEHGFVSMIPHQGNYFISWLDGRNTGSAEGKGHEEGHHGQMTLRGAILNQQGNKSAEWELDNRVCDCCQTSAAMTANGPVVVYRDRSESEIRDISIVRFVNGQWTTPKTIFDDNWNIAGCPVNGPRLDAKGNDLAVAWFSSPDKKAEVNVVFSKDAGASFTAPIKIDEGNGIGRVDVILLDASTALVSWMEGSAIKAAKVHSDGKKEPSIEIAASSTSRSSGFPQMTHSGNRIVFAWTDDALKKIQTASISLQ